MHQALPRLTNRDKVVEMVDPTLKDNYSKKELIQASLIGSCFLCHRAARTEM